MRLIERFQVCLHRVRQTGFLHTLNRALQCQQAMDAGGRINLLNFQPRGFGADLPQSLRGFNSHLNQLLLHSLADVRQEELEDPILAAVGSFLQDKASWKGTATELLEALLKINSSLLAKPNSLVRKLNAKTRELSERYGIRYLGRREENVKYLILEWVSDKNDMCDISGTPPGV